MLIETLLKNHRCFRNHRTPLPDHRGDAALVETPRSGDAGKPPQSYIELIAAAILGSPEKRLILPARARQPPLLSLVVVRMAQQHPPQPVGERVLREVETRPERTRILLVGARRMRRRLRARRLQPPIGAQPVPVRQ